MAKNTLIPSNHSHCDLFNNKEAAEYIGVTPRTLEVWRSTKRNQISYIKVGSLVKYRRSDLDIFLEHRTVNAQLD